MTNGSNDWGVPFSHIMWLERFLKSHGNIVSVERSRDILFIVSRRTTHDSLNILCLREYTMGLTFVQRALNEFGQIDIIYIGGGWSGYTPEAKDYCLGSKIGLFVTDEMSGTLWSDEYWSYHQRDKDGNPKYFIRTA